MASDPAKEPEDLLQNARWLRRLARRLVRDADRAEDLEQEVLLAGLRQGEGRLPPRPWLARVARNLAIDGLRREQRRHEAERRAEIRGESRASAELAAEAELQLRAGRALLALPEPYRSTLLAHFFGGDSARQIARREKAPVETVRTRIKRGLERLRRQLDAHHGGRAGWLAPLGTGLGPRATAGILVGTGIMKGKIAWIAAAAALATVVWVNVPTGVEPVQQPADEPPAGTESARVAEDPTPLERTLSATTEPRQETEPTDDSCTLLVRTRWSTGEPAAQVTVQVATRPYLPGADYRTDAEGELRVTGLDAEDDLRLSTVRTFGRFSTHSVEDLHPGETRILEWTFDRGTRVEGIVLDATGAPVAGAELVSHSPGVWPSFPISVGTSDAEGRFSLRDMPSVWCLVARADGHAESDAQLIANLPRVEQELRQAELRLLADPGGIDLTVLDPSGQPVADAWVCLHTDTGSRTSHPADRMAATDRAGSARFDGLRPGQHRLQVYSEGFSEWVEQVQVNSWIQDEVIVQLQPGAAVEGTITDAQGEPQADVTISDHSPSSIRVTRVQSDVKGWYRLDDLPTGERTLEFHPPSHAVTHRTVTVAPGQTDVLDVNLGTESRVIGRLLDENGNPLAGWLVRKVPVPFGFYRASRTDAAGRFVLADCEEAGVDLGVSSGPMDAYVQIWRRVLPLPREQDFVVAEENRVPSAWIEGRLLLPDGTALSGHPLFLHQEGRRIFRAKDLASPSTDADGRFSWGPLPAGRYRLGVAETPHLAMPSLREFEVAAGERHDLGEQTLQSGGALEVRVTGNAAQRAALQARLQAPGEDTLKGRLYGETIHFLIAPAGPWTLVLESPDVDVEEVRVQITAGETTTVTVALPR